MKGSPEYFIGIFFESAVDRVPDLQNKKEKISWFA
jgi:hypothetical protein